MPLKISIIEFKIWILTRVMTVNWSIINFKLKKKTQIEIYERNIFYWKSYRNKLRSTFKVFLMHFDQAKMRVSYHQFWYFFVFFFSEEAVCFSFVLCFPKNLSHSSWYVPDERRSGAQCREIQTILVIAFETLKNWMRLND